MNLILIAITAYLIGSIPFGVIITKLLGLGDVREIGSGNIGATNVLRTGNKGAALATLLLDGFKGFAAVWLARDLAPQFIGVAFLAVLLGHCFPIWLKFNGGKGVATYIGALFGLNWVMGIIAICFWVIIAITRKISSLAALTMVVMMVFFGLFFASSYVIWLGLAAALIIYQHRANIARLRQGTEPKIGQKN